MRLRPSSYVWLFRLSSFTGELPASPSCRFRPTLHSGLPLLLARKLTMQSGRNVTSSSGGSKDCALQTEPELFCNNIPAVTVEDTGPQAEKTRVGSLVVNERNLRTPSPLCGANYDDDSEAESFRDGRTEEVDRDTKGRAFAWCRDFLSGPWKTIQEEDFQISIVRWIKSGTVRGFFTTYTNGKLLDIVAKTLTRFKPIFRFVKPLFCPWKLKWVMALLVFSYSDHIRPGQKLMEKLQWNHFNQSFLCSQI